MPEKNHVLSAVGVSRSFDGGRSLALKEINVSLQSGESVGIVGESGSGKSTLARIMAALETTSSGHVALDGTPVPALLRTKDGRLHFRRTVQLVSQDTTSSFDPRRDLRHSVRAPLLTLHRMSPRHADSFLDERAASLELDPGILERRPREVSGGQRQRIAILRALAARPRLLICDEAISALDVSVQATVLNALKDAVLDDGIGMIFVSHSLPATAFISDHLLVMNHGEVVERGRTETTLATPQNAYTRLLLEAFEPARQTELAEMDEDALAD